MKRITVGLLVVLGVVTAIVVLLLARPKDGTSPSSHFTGATRRRASGLQARPGRRPRSRSGLAPRSGRRGHARVRARAGAQAHRGRRHGGAPARREEDAATPPRQAVERCRSRSSAREDRRARVPQQAARDGLPHRRVQAPGGGLRFRRRRGRGRSIPDCPGKPAQIIARKASPFDDDPEDATISQTFFSSADAGRRSEWSVCARTHDEVWGAYVAAHRPKVEELRREVRSTLDTYFGK